MPKFKFKFLVRINLLSRWKYQFSYNHWSQASWSQPVFRWVKLSGEWWVLVYSELGVKPPWLLREMGNSAPEADPRIPSKQKKRIYLSFLSTGWTQWLPWSECTKTCNGGFKSRNKNCVDTDTSELLDSSNCGAGSDPVERLSCNTDLCAGKMDFCSSCEVYHFWGTLNLKMSLSLCFVF